MSKVLIEMSGGVIQFTVSDDPNLQIAIVDWDALDDSLGEDSDPLRSVGSADFIEKNIFEYFIEDENNKDLIKELKELKF